MIMIDISKTLATNIREPRTKNYIYNSGYSEINLKISSSNDP